MSVEENKATIRLMVEEVWNKGNLSVIDKHIAPEFMYKGPFGEYKGVEGFKQMVTSSRKAIPDLHYTIDKIVGEGDTVAVLYTSTGTLKGELMGIPPTGKRFSMQTAFFYRFKDGKEAEALPFSDSLTMFRQLGIPLPKE